MNQPLTLTAAQKAGPTLTVVALGIALGMLLAMPLLHLLPADNAFHVSAYTLTLVGKILCYAIVALALDRRLAGADLVDAELGDEVCLRVRLWCCCIILGQWDIGRS